MSTAVEEKREREEQLQHALDIEASAASSVVVAPTPRAAKLKLVADHLAQDVDLDGSTWTMITFCFMTGYIDSVSFTQCFIWCAFQTGNTIQLGLAIARLFTGHPHDTSMRTPDRQALVSLLAFLAGATIGRLSNPESRFLGARRRAWLALGTFICALLTLGGALASHFSRESSFAGERGEPSWIKPLGFLALACISASMGLQANLGSRLGSHFATSVVLTTIWVQIMCDPKLLALNIRVAARDRRALAVLFLLIGGIVGRALIDSIGSPATLAIGAGVRLVIAASWFFVPAAVKK